MTKLAINGGTKVIETALKPYNTIGVEEASAVQDVISTGILSAYVAGDGPEHLGGPFVRSFEAAWSEKFGVEHSITVNSWTSGLICCVGATEIEPFSEVITSPWTMCATATSILHWNAIPVFADIDPGSFTIDPASVESLISDRTSAILAVDIFGRECELQSLQRIATKHGIKLITDSAQAPLVASNNGDYFVGTKSDVGGFSLNYHKHFHTGEGGVVVTNDDRIAAIARGIRNHGEANNSLISAGYRNLVGHNFRLGELEAAIGTCQLAKGDNLIVRRQQVAKKLYYFFGQFEGISVPLTEDLLDHHGFYVFPILINDDIVKIPRSKIISALEAEGIFGFMDGYVNLSSWDFFNNQIGYGANSFPWSYAGRRYIYGEETVPVTAMLHNRKFLGFEMCLYELNDTDLQLLMMAFEKVWSNLQELK